MMTYAGTPVRRMTLLQIFATVLFAALLYAAPLAAQEAPAPAPESATDEIFTDEEISATGETMPDGEMTLLDAGEAALPHDLSPWGMFLAADIVVKAVMIGLVFASIVTWTIWLAKKTEITRAKHRAKSAFAALAAATSLD